MPKARTSPEAASAVAKEKSANFMEASPWIRVQSEVNQAPELRRPLLAQLETHFDATVIAFFVSFRSPDAIISDADAEMLESILAVEHVCGKKLVLILNAPGGQALAAERIVNVCRAYSGGNFHVVVPHMAKSAATMICFGSSKILMSKTSELGPVDPQVWYKDDAEIVRRISAEEYVRAYAKLMKEASDGDAKRIEPFLQQLQRFDARYIESLTSAQQLSKDLSIRLLKSGMMSNVEEAEIGKRIEVFLSQQKTSSHGRMINYEGAKECGLDVDLIDLQSSVWNALWEFYVRAEWTLGNRHTKLLESAESALGVSN